jgi:Uma2 family endonuclease
MAATTHLLTVEEFLQLPDDSRGWRQELYHGEPITVSPPKLNHSLIQRNLVKLIEPWAERGSLVHTEVGYLPLPEHEFWTADVAYLSAERFRRADPEDNIRGAPELVVEVLSPSNTAAEIYDKEQTCLANGSKEFWVADPKRRTLRVTTEDGRTKTYSAGQEVSLGVLGSDATIRVDDVFAY